MMRRSDQNLAETFFFENSPAFSTVDIMPLSLNH